MRRGELWWADLGAHRPQEQTGRRPVIVWQGDALTPGPSLGARDPASVALAFQIRAIPKSALVELIRPLSIGEIAEVELATDEALGRVEPE